MDPRGLDIFPQELITAKGVFLLDIEGVICDNIDEGNVLERVPDFIRYLKAHGKKVAIISNISRKPRNVVYRQLVRMGLPLKEEEVFTSGSATALYIKSNFPGQKCFVISEWGLRHDIAEAGVELSEEGDVGVVAVGANRKLTYSELNHAMRLVIDGAELVCSGTTLNFKGSFHGDHGLFMGEAAISEALRQATSHPITYIGKPHPMIFKQVLMSLGSDPVDSLMIGDTLSSDIAGANRSGIDSILVSRGEKVELDLIKEDQKPKVVVRDIAELYSFLPS